MKDCESCVHEYLSPMSDTCRECGIAMLNYEERKPMTHFDEIKAMSVEELAKYINEISNGDCPTVGDCPEGLRENETCTPWQCWLYWLKSPVDKEVDG